MTDCWKYHQPEFTGDCPPDWNGGTVHFQSDSGRWLKARPDWDKKFRYRYKANSIGQYRPRCGLHDAASKIEPEPEPRCENCKFYDRGECKRYPPTQLGTGSYSQHVRVQVYDWCGEFVKK